MAPIGIFDSGYGGLTILRAIRDQLPQYDFIYLGDNARSPYGTRSFDTVYQYTKQCVEWLFSKQCPLVILACNTASAKAIKNIQRKDMFEKKKKNVLGVIRPTAEVIGNFSRTGRIGILGTKGTIQSGSYLMEINKFFPDASVYQQACPLWVTLLENNEQDSGGAAYFIERDINELLEQCAEIDTILLGCTHYPLLIDKIKKYLPKGIQLVSQGDIIAKKLEDYLNRHPEIESLCTKNQKLDFYTTDSPTDFDVHSTAFFGEKVHSVHVELG